MTEPLSNTDNSLALDVDLQQARALHRVMRALNDGACPKCHNISASSSCVRANYSDMGIYLQCPKCNFMITSKEIIDIEEMFAPAMDAAVAVFEQWRATRANKG